jgi:hypothetical protein
MYCTKQTHTPETLSISLLAAVKSVPNPAAQKRLSKPRYNACACNQNKMQRTNPNAVT